MVCHLSNIQAIWPAPTWVRAFTTTKEFNFSHHQLQNRSMLEQELNLPYPLPWLTQTHSDRVVYVNDKTTLPIEADATWTDQPGQACVVLTGDCLPLLLCNTSGTVIAAVHGGWKGLLNGIIENTVMAMRTKTHDPIIAWMGPAIGPQCFEVQADVVEPFIAADPFARGAFIPREQAGKWLGNIYELAKSRLRQLEIYHVYGGEHCTYTEQTLFFSARQNSASRMATIIWINSPL